MLKHYYEDVMGRHKKNGSDFAMDKVRAALQASIKLPASIALRLTRGGSEDDRKLYEYAALVLANTDPDRVKDSLANVSSPALLLKAVSKIHGKRQILASCLVQYCKLHDDRVIGPPRSSDPAHSVLGKRGRGEQSSSCAVQ